MNANVESLIFEQLRRAEDKLDLKMERGMETRERLGHLKEGLASLSRRVARIDNRLSRLERRLDIQDAH